MADPRQEALAQSVRCFTLAHEQGAPINLVFLLDKCEVTRFTAPCIMIKNGYFVIRAELEQLASHPIVWGAEVSGHFVIMDAGRPVTCHFLTKLARIYNGPLNSVYLVFPVPESLDHNQRRFSKRVNMEPESVAGFGVWFGRPEGGGPEDLPVLTWVALENADCELGELSASGLRLDAQESCPLTYACLHDPVLLKGDFGKAGEPNPLFVRGVIVRSMAKPETEGVISFGCHFLAWRKVTTTHPNMWFRADEDGVPAIAEWLNRNFRAVAS